MVKRSSTVDVFDQVRDADAEESGQAEDAEQLALPEPEGTEDPETSPTPSSRLSTRRGAASVAGLLIIVVLLATSTALGWGAYQEHRTTAAAAAALAAAREYAVVLTTLDSKNIDENYQRSLEGATGEFKDAYSQGSAQLRQVLIDNDASGTGVVVDAAVKSATPETAEILLFVDQSITNAANPSPRIDRNRILMSMQLIDGRWLASEVEIL